MHRTQNLTAPAADTDDSTVVVTPADTLRGAATYLQLRGWTKKSYYAADPGYVSGLPADPFPPACVLGAIGMAAHGTRTNCPELEGPNVRDFNRAAEYLRWYLLDEGHLATGADPWCTPTDIGAWNDLDWHIAADITTALRSAADEYDMSHASPDDLETYAETCVAAETHPTRDGFLAWRGAR